MAVDQLKLQEEAIRGPEKPVFLLAPVSFIYPFWLVGEFTTHFRTFFSGAWDAHWG